MRSFKRLLHMKHQSLTVRENNFKMSTLGDCIKLVVSAISYKGDNFCDFLLAFLHNKAFLNRGLL